MFSVHSSAIVDTDAIGENVTIGAFAVIEAGVRLGDGVVVHPHVVICAGAIIGAGTEIFPGAVIGRTPKAAGIVSRPIEFARKVEIGEGCSIGAHAVVYYDVAIGANTLLGDGASIREKCRIGKNCIISRYVTLNYSVTVGDRVKIMDMTHITGNTVIEDEVFVSTGVSTSNDNSMSKMAYNAGMVGPRLLRGSAIGMAAALLPNVVIGKDALVASGAVVTRDVEPGQTVFGVPAHPRSPDKKT